MIDQGFELAGRGFGLSAAALSTALQVPEILLLGSPRRTDPDIGRLGPLPFDEARRLPAANDGDLFTTAHGHGPSFLFVHGFAMTSRVWTKQFQTLPRSGVRTVAFDHRGHGASTASMIDTEIDNLADDIRVVVEGLNLRDAVLVGHSMGGMALLAFALRHPDVMTARVRGLVLVSATARFEYSLPLVRGAVEPFTRGFVRSGVWSLADWSTFAARLLFGKEPVPSQIEAARRVLLASAREETVIACARAMAEFDVSRQLDKITAPTLVIGGTADLLTTPRDARRLTRGLPNARMELIAGAGHMVMLERAERLGALILGFARELGVATGLAA